MKRRLIPDGLYIMDQNGRGELCHYLSGVLRHRREYPPLPELLSQNERAAWSELRGTPAGERIEARAGELLRDLLRGEDHPALPEGYGDYVRALVGSVRGSREAENLLRALEGRYIYPARGGDPIRDPEVYPSGRAMFAFDPRHIPTVAAQARGAEAVRLLLEGLHSKNGRYPGTVAVVLWGFETMKTGGDTIAAILELLGVRLHKKGTWFRELEVIPLEQLGRPRIDVMITICGIFRDTFATHLELLNRAVEPVAGCRNPRANFVRKHYLEAKPRLGELALARIFGPSPEEYATAMTTLWRAGLGTKKRSWPKASRAAWNNAYLQGLTAQTKKPIRDDPDRGSGGPGKR